MKKILISLIHFYQKMPLSSHSKCRFTPTCSEYAIESIETYGSLKGSFLAIKRILRCHPFGGYGFDPVPKKEMSMKKVKVLLLSLILLPLVFLASGCTNDSMDNIEIVVTNYPNEFIMKRLYEKHATITSIYPDGVDINAYKFSKKQINDTSKVDLFVYNGLLEKERDLAVDLLAINPNLKIIDTAYVLETDYSPEELWLNPNSLLMMSQNIRLAMDEYVSSTYLRKEIEDAYDELKIELSEIDADYRVAVENTDNKTIIVGDSALKYLEKFGLNVICIDSDASQKTMADAENIINDAAVSYVITFKGSPDNENVTAILEKYPALQKLELHRLDIISDDERRDKENYTSIMRNNLELIKKELYQ